MKVLLLFNRWAFPANDGGTVAMCQLATGLKEVGHELTIFTLNPSRSAVDPEKIKEKTYFFDYTLVPIKTDLSYIHAGISLLKNESYHAIRFNSLEAHEQLKQLLLKEQFDVVIADSIYMSWYIPTVKKYSKAKVVLRLHNVENEIWKGVARDEKNPIKKLYIQILAKQLERFEIEGVKQADALITLSQNDLDFFNTLKLQCPTMVSYTGIDIDKLKPYAAFESRNDSVFHIAAMDWKPNVQGVEWFIKQVWPKIVYTYPKATLHIAGKKMPESLLDLRLNNYHNEGFVDNQFEFMAQNKVMVVPLFAGSGIRIKIIEAMAMKKAIVATTKAVQGLDLLHNKHILIADNDQEFAECVVSLLKDKSLYDRIADEAYIYATQCFDLKKNASELTQFLSSI